MTCLPRYKLVELLCYVVMGFFPALVILSMVSSLVQRDSHLLGGTLVLAGPASWEGLLRPRLWQQGKQRPSGSVC